MKIRFDVPGIQWTGKKWGLSKSMDVDHGLTRTHTHSTNYEYETKQKIDDGVLVVLNCDFIVLAETTTTVNR